MQMEETNSRDCEDSARRRCIAEVLNTGAGALIATGTTPACRRAQTEQRSGAREACG
jgi:hypothetical protein